MPADLPTPPPGYRLVRTRSKAGRPPELGEPVPAGARKRQLPPVSDAEYAAARELIRAMRATRNRKDS